MLLLLTYTVFVQFKYTLNYITVIKCVHTSIKNNFTVKGFSNYIKTLKDWKGNLKTVLSGELTAKRTF